VNVAVADCISALRVLQFVDNSLLFFDLSVDGRKLFFDPVQSSSWVS